MFDFDRYYNQGSFGKCGGVYPVLKFGGTINIG